MLHVRLRDMGGGRNDVACHVKMFQEKILHVTSSELCWKDVNANSGLINPPPRTREKHVLLGADIFPRKKLKSLDEDLECF